MNSNIREEVNMTEENKARVHSFMMEEGAKTHMTAVKSVPAFDSNSMDIVLDEEHLHIEGEHIEIDRLDLEAGELDITGKVKRIMYSKTAIPKNFWRRIFK